MEHYSTMKEEMLSLATSWRKTGHYAKEDKPNRGRQILYGITYMKNRKKSFKANFTETSNKMVIFRGRGRRKWGDISRKVHVFSSKKTRF